MREPSTKSNLVLGEHEPLAPLTTLGVGGRARFFAEAAGADELAEAAAFARARQLPLRMLGAGSNVLVPDEGVSAVVVRLSSAAIFLDGDTLIADAGASWDAVVDFAAARGLWGVENLAGIPGTAGGAAVQNIGAYGASLEGALAWVEALDGRTGIARRLTRRACALGYRDSVFKRERNLLITRVALRLARRGAPNLAYADLAQAAASGASLDTPAQVARAVRRIRAKKFPDLSREGTAGSFFKNPVVSASSAAALSARYPALPLFPQADGSVKLPLGWLFDHALGLRGFARGNVRLYERQALVIVAARGASAREIDAFARAVAARAQEAFGIRIEREVETFS